MTADPCWHLKQRDTPQREITNYMHRVYIGVFHPHPEVMFVKVGMTSNTQLRIKQYAGMVPGGLSSMHIAHVPSRSEALRAEKSILCALNDSELFDAIGGEWFRCAPTSHREALAQLEATTGNITQARVNAPRPFNSLSRGKRLRRKIR